MTKIVGMCGQAGCGKTTVATYLVEHYGARRYAFADPLKQLCIRTLDFADVQLNGTQAQKEAVDPRYGFSARWFIQRLGTEGVRSVFGPDFWWRYALSKIVVDAPDVAVIEDVRFVNEARGTMAMDPNPRENIYITADMIVEIGWLTLGGRRAGMAMDDFLHRLDGAFRSTLGEVVELGAVAIDPGYVWRLEPVLANASQADPTHASEAEWSKCPYDLRIAPRGPGLEELFKLVDRAAAFCEVDLTAQASTKAA